MMNREYSLAAVISVGLLTAITGCGSTRDVSFKEDVGPILGKYCAECHTAQGEGAKKSGFEIGSYDAVMKGTSLGSVVVAGDSASSTLYRLVSGKVHASIRMPHGKEELAAEEVAVIKNWIDQGAKNN